MTIHATSSGQQFRRSTRWNPIPVGARLKERSAPSENGCWTWRGATGNHGYGRICVEGKYRLAHRVSYETFVGSIPEGLHIDHLCRNRLCVNPAHLEAVTPRENLRRGNATKITREIVVEVRAALGVIAERHGVSAAHLRNAVSTRAWKDVPW